MNYAWDIFKQYAPHNPHLADFKQFDYFVECLKSKQSFHIARYNDGEWIVALKIEPHYTYCVMTHMHNFQEVGDISQKMLTVIDSQPPYFIGIDSSTLALTGSILPAKDVFLEKIKPLKVVYGEIFNAATVMFGIDVLVKPLLDRWVVTVGPDYMKRLKISENHITVPLHNCWNQAEEVQKQIDARLDCNLDQKPVVVYSCSLLAKWLVDVFYRQYGDNITQIDIGSCIDPWCGVVSRPWHNALLKTYGLHNRLKPEKQINSQSGYPQYGYTRNSIPSKPPETKPAARSDRQPKQEPQPTTYVPKYLPKPEIAKTPPPPPPPPPPLPLPKVVPVYKPKHKRDPNAPIVLPASISTGRPAPRSGFK